MFRQIGNCRIGRRTANATDRPPRCRWAFGGVRTGELTWEAICWEKTTGMFLRRGVLECRALFLAESAVESGEFLDFRLKGVMSE